MNRLSPKSWSKGFKAFIGIAVVLVLLIALFGRSQDNSIGNGSAYGRGESTASSQGTYYGQAAVGRDYARTKGAPAAIPAPAPSAAPEATSNPAPMPQESYIYDQGLANSGGANADGKVEVTFSEAVSGALPADRKIINDGSVQVETKEFDQSISAIDQIIIQSGGFAESRYVQGNSINTSNLRYATIVFRVPADKFKDIMANMSVVGTVTQSNTSGTDITDQYVDSETRLKTLKVQEQTLLDILAKAAKIEDVITLESRISDVQYQIESIENQLMNYDRLVQYSRISVNINEVVEITDIKPIPRTLGDKIAEAFNNAIQAFTDGLENFTLWLVANWILFAFFLVLLVVFITIRVIYRKRKQKRIGSLPEKKETESGNNQEI